MICLKLKLSNIKFSRNDLKREIILPIQMSPQLSELIGILLGDGHVGIHRSSSTSKCKYIHYQIIIVGHYIDDVKYLNYVNNLFFHLFHIKFNSKTIRNNGTIRLTINSKAIVNFLIDQFHLQKNKKSEKTCIPEKIMNSTVLVQRAFIKGLADTDFTFCFKKKHKDRHYYPVIKGKFVNKRIVENLKVLFNKLDFSSSTCYNESSFDKRFSKKDIGHSIYLNGKHNLLKWINEIGFSNYKHIIKTNIWSIYDFVPPNISLIEKENILQRKINPNIYYN